MVPPTMPPFASRPEPPKLRPMYMFLWPVLPMDSLPFALKSLVVQLGKEIKTMTCTEDGAELVNW